MGVRSFALPVFNGNSVISTVNVNCETVCPAHSDVLRVRECPQTRPTEQALTRGRNARAGAARTTTHRTLADRSIDAKVFPDLNSQRNNSLIIS